MGIWETIGNVLGGAASKAGDKALDFGGQWAYDKWIADPNSAEAYNRQKEFYRNRYQWMVKDMRRAGINPILAASSAGFSTGGTPSVAQAQGHPGSGASDISSAYRNFVEGIQSEEETKTEKVRQLNELAKTKTEIERRRKVRAETGKTSREEDRIWFEIEKLHSETIKNMKEGFRTDADKIAIMKKIEMLEKQLKRLGRIDKIYGNRLSWFLSILREVANSIGINAGVQKIIK
jgi:hypothetical protein